jgi:hypothetical protein
LRISKEVIKFILLSSLFLSLLTSRLTVEDVAKAIPRLGLVINLTNTLKYYSLEDWTLCGIECRWIKTEGELD